MIRKEQALLVKTVGVGVEYPTGNGNDGQPKLYRISKAIVNNEQPFLGIF